MPKVTQLHLSTSRKSLYYCQLTPDRTDTFISMQLDEKYKLFCQVESSETMTLRYSGNIVPYNCSIEENNTNTNRCHKVENNFHFTLICF